MDFGEVLSKAWKITWKFKVLWIFGIFASCGTRSGPSFNGGGSSGYETGGGAPGPTPNLPPGFEDNLLRFVRLFENPAVIAVFLSLICVLVLLTIFFSIIGRIGLIKGAMDVDAGAEHLSFGELWKSGLQYFWRFFGLSLLIGSPVLLIYLTLAAGGIIFFFIYLSGSQGNSSNAAASALTILLVFCMLACVLFLLAIVISFLSPQAERAIVIENQGVISGLRRGWNVLTNNLGPILIVWIITVVIGFVAGIVIALPLLIVVIPAFFAFFMSGNQTSYTPLIVAGLCILAYIPVSLVANGILMTYIQSLWTLTYLRLIQPKPEAGTPLVSPANA